MVSPELPVIVGFVVLVLATWSPLLAVERIRALFCWPTNWFAVNYLLIGTGVVLLQCLSYLAVFLAVAGIGPVTGGEAATAIGGIAGVNILVPTTAGIAAVRLLPQRGIWTPDGDGLSGRIGLVVGVIWYAIVTTTTIIILGLVLMFANLPM